MYDNSIFKKIAEVKENKQKIENYKKIFAKGKNICKNQGGVKS